MDKAKRVLLSSVCKPFGVDYGDSYLTSYTGSQQILWAQHIFRPWTTANQYGIDFIAQNLETPTVTLHYPSMDRFIAEIKKGYDYVGIAFVLPTMHKMVPMVEAVRKHAPNTKVVLGGYGAALGEEALAPYADYVCKTEGVQFMRELLGERIDRPIMQPDIIEASRIFTFIPIDPMGVIVAGLGCPNGCDFCATSAFFEHKHIRFLKDGNAVLDAIEGMRARHPGLSDFYVSDEDFLLDETFGRSFLAAVRERNPAKFSLQIYGSIRALSQYTATELLEMGVDAVWIGYEGQRAGYQKMRGRTYPDLIADLKAHGITVVTSMIIGYDYQTVDVIWQEFDALMAMRPSFCQFLIYGPSPGTPLWRRYLKDGRMDPGVANDFLNVASRKGDGASLTFTHPHIGAPEMEAIQRELYREEYRRLGPSMFRTVDDWLAKYLALKDHPVARLRAKAEDFKRRAHQAQMVLPASCKYVNANVAAYLQDLEQRLCAATGPLSTKERAIRLLASPLLRFEDFRYRFDIGHQPVTSRREYRMAQAPKRAAEALQQATEPV
jgi:haloalkane dehalogenase